MQKIIFIALSTLFIFSIEKKEWITVEKEKPNILFISIDDLNDWPGFLGNFPKVHTPNMDKLAENGMVFNNAHCQAPICAPSRTSLFTGLYPHSTGLYYQFPDKEIHEGSEKAKNTIFLPDYFENHGYKTLGVGKIFHNGDKLSVFQEFGDVFQGFGPRPETPLNYSSKWFSDIRRTGTDWGPMDLSDSEMTDYEIADWAIEKIGQNHEKPFFFAVGFIRPHVPWYVPEKWFDLFDINSIETPPYLENDLDDVPEVSRRLHEMPAMPNTQWLIEEGKWKSMVHSYLASTAFVDHQIGRVLTALENSPYRDNTIVVLWSDHGYHLGEKERTCKHSLWQRATRVPLVFAGPNIKKGSNTDAAVGLIDLYPTLLEMCGLPKYTANEGHSLMPLIINPKEKWPHVAITSYGYKNISLYDKNYHFIHYADGTGELYDLRKDPNEWDNLFDQPDFEKVVMQFKALMPKNHAPISPVNKINANEYIDAELLKFGIEPQY
ncbi:MAG: sulfatase [Flavobacteriaceae bacterium]|nr:sulfatase [Flavobacteriaceae bacterium]